MNFFLRAPSARPLQILFHPAILVLSLTCTPFDCRFVRKLLMELHLVSSQHFEKRKSRNKSRNARSSQESVFERTQRKTMVRPLSLGHVSGWWQRERTCDVLPTPPLACARSPEPARILPLTVHRENALMQRGRARCWVWNWSGICSSVIHQT